MRAIAFVVVGLFVLLSFFGGVVTLLSSPPLGLALMAAACLVGMQLGIYENVAGLAMDRKRMIELAEEEKDERGAMLRALERIAGNSEAEKVQQARQAARQVTPPKRPPPAADPAFDAAIAADLSGNKKVLR